LLEILISSRPHIIVNRKGCAAEMQIALNGKRKKKKMKESMNIKK